MREKLMVMMCAMAFGTVGCNKKAPAAGAGSGAAAGSAAVVKVESGSASATTAGSATTGSAAAPSSGSKCASPTAYQSPAGKFCIEPHGFKPEEGRADEYNAMVSFYRPIPNSAMKDSFTVSVSLQDEMHSSYEGMTTGMNERSKDPKKVISKGDLTDVEGKFLVENVGNHQAESLQLIVKSKTHAYACGGENYSPTVPPDILAACKSIRPVE